MQVLFITPRYYPYIGGVEYVVKSIAERIRDSVVLCGDPNIDEIKEEEINGVQVFRWPTYAPSNAYHFPRKRSQLMEFLKRILRDIDIVHVHSAHAVFSVYSGLKVKEIDKNKIIFFSPYYHGRGHTKLANLLWKTIFKNTVRTLLEQSSIIIVNSNFQKNKLLNDFRIYSNLDNNIKIVYDGVDIQNIKNAKPMPNIKGCNEKILLCVSRLEPYKNIHLSIKVLQHLPESFKLMIVGKGSNNYRKYLLKLASNKGVLKRVHLLGYQQDEIVWRLYKTADVFLHLSEVESFGMTCLESLAAGTPVIVNNDKAGLKETAELFPKYIKIFDKNKMSLKDLANMIEETVELKPVKVDLSKFSWNNIAKLMKSIYQEYLMS